MIDGVVFRSRFCTCTPIGGRGQSGLMRWILLWLMPLLQDRSLDLLNQQSSALPLDNAYGCSLKWSLDLTCSIACEVIRLCDGYTLLFNLSCLTNCFSLIPAIQNDDVRVFDARQPRSDSPCSAGKHGTAQWVTRWATLIKAIVQSAVHTIPLFFEDVRYKF